jgi:DNA-binding response OmpR family regulator
MLNGLAILIVEDEAFAAMDLADFIVHAEGVPVGPAATVAEALTLLENEAVDAAILDANLLDRDVTPVALRLIELGLAFVIHSALGLPDELAARHPHLTVVMKPARPTVVLAALLQLVSPK